MTSKEDTLSVRIPCTGCRAAASPAFDLREVAIGPVAGGKDRHFGVVNEILPDAG